MRGFVLAGGASRRFGSCKALHPVDGVPMVLRVARVLGQAGLDVELVVRDTGLADLGFPLLQEPQRSDFHPLYGLQAVLKSLAPGECALVAPCDMPWLSTDGIRALLAAGAPAVASDGHQIHPLLCLVPGLWVPRVEDILRRGGPARDLFAEVAQVVMDPADLANINRREDLATGL